jgi:hypothetical protein
LQKLKKNSFKFNVFAPLSSFHVNWYTLFPLKKMGGVNFHNNLHFIILFHLTRTLFIDFKREKSVQIRKKNFPWQPWCLPTSYKLRNICGRYPTHHLY